MSRKKPTPSDVGFERLNEVINRLKDRPNEPLCFDSETSGLDYKRNAIVGYVCAFGPAPTDSFYLPFRHHGVGNLGGQAGLDAADGWDRRTLARGEADLISGIQARTKLVFGHNLSFDLKFMAQVGYKFDAELYEDTMLNATLLNEWQGKFGLEFCANKAGVQGKKSAEIVAYLRAKFPEIKDDYEAMGHFWRLSGDDPMAVEYATGDGTTTWQLRDWQREKLAEEELLRVHNVECRLIPRLAEMSLRGIRVDEERLADLSAHIDTRLEQLLSKFPRMGKDGLEDFNVRSSEHVQHFVGALHGRTDWPLTAKFKRPSFPEDWLSTHEPGQQIVEVRKLLTLKNTFLTPLRDTHLWNGRVHTTYWQLRGDQFGTVTGRLSSSDPNLQAIPKHDEAIGRIYRRIFIPDDGMTWAETDYQQCEPRLLADYSGCKVLVDDFCDNPHADAHLAVTIATNKSIWESLSKDERKIKRQTGKRVNQTLLTGGGANVLHNKYKVGKDVAEAKQIMADYFAAMPEIKTLQKQAQARMSNRGFIRSLLGRRARLNDPSKAFVGLNRLLQCGNADILKLKLVEMTEYLKAEKAPVQILNNNHDAYSFQFTEEGRAHLRHCLDIMVDFSPGQPIELGIPMAIDYTEGPDWGIATYGEEKT